MNRLALVTFVSLLAAAPALAGGMSGFKAPPYAGIENPLIESDTWAALRGEVAGEMALLDGEDLIAFEAPVTAYDAATVPFTIRQREDSGVRFRKMTVVVDENPMPVAAEFEFGPQMGDIDIESRVRFDVYSNIRVIATTEEGQTFMVGRFVQAAGGCTAAVTRDLEVALSTMGVMKLREIDHSGGAAPRASGQVRQAQLMIRHPMFTGMQVKKGSLDTIDPRFIDRLEVRLGDDMLFTMTGGFSISEDPSFRFSYVDNGASEIIVRATDTDGAVFEAAFPLNTGA